MYNRFHLYHWKPFVPKRKHRRFLFLHVICAAVPSAYFNHAHVCRREKAADRRAFINSAYFAGSSDDRKFGAALRVYVAVFMYLLSVILASSGFGNPLVLKLCGLYANAAALIAMGQFISV